MKLRLGHGAEGASSSCRLRRASTNLHGKAGTWADTSVSVMASGPTGLTISLIGATPMRTGAMLSPCMALVF